MDRMDPYYSTAVGLVKGNAPWKTSVFRPGWQPAFRTGSIFIIRLAVVPVRPVNLLRGSLQVFLALAYARALLASSRLANWPVFVDYDNQRNRDRGVGMLRGRLFRTSWLTWLNSQVYIGLLDLQGKFAGNTGGSGKGQRDPTPPLIQPTD